YGAVFTQAKLSLSVFCRNKEVPMRAVSLRPNFSRVLRTISLFAIALLLPTLVCAQAYFGTVGGELTDSTGAVVQGATVILTDQQKGFQFTTTTDSSGRYLFRSVAPGTYLVSAEVKGFEKVSSKPFKVDINENATTNLAVKVAGASQTIQVEAQ